MTIKEIAEKAGVSMMTVSNVINKKYSKVSNKTVEKVNKIIEENHYVPNLSARNLSAQNSKIIAIFLPFYKEFENSENLFSNPYISQILGLIEKKLRQNGYFAMIRSVDNIKDTNTFLQNWKVDGAIFIFPFYHENVEKLIKNNHIPLVFMDYYSDNPNILSVNIDDYKGTYIATKYLINKGHTNIAFVAKVEDNPLLLQRYNGYKDALLSSEIKINEDNIFDEDLTYLSGVKIGKKIASRKDITAVVTTADVCAIGILEGAKLSGLSIPNDLSVIGYDNLPISTYVSPKLTTIDQHIDIKGERVIELLFDRLTNNNKVPNKLIIDVDLIERQSVSNKYIF